MAEEVIEQGGSVSPILTIEPRRRKFHKAITITMPLPGRATSVAQRQSARLVICRSWVQTPLGAGLFFSLFFLSLPTSLNQWCVLYQVPQGSPIMCCERNRKNGCLVALPAVKQAQLACQYIAASIILYQFPENTIIHTSSELLILLSSLIQFCVQAGFINSILSKNVEHFHYWSNEQTH